MERLQKKTSTDVTQLLWLPEQDVLWTDQSVRVFIYVSECTMCWREGERARGVLVHERLVEQPILDA